jgi:pimeloyl-ACP methyl ester carboxylesterase
MQPVLAGVEFAYYETNGVRLHVAQAGPPDGPLVLLLHGFPEFWYAWRYQIPQLAQAGFRVWAADQRGYNLSDKPQQIKSYNVDELAADAIGLIDAAGVQQATLIGHDWGGAVAWWTAIKYPQRLNRLVILNVPHPVVMRRQLRSSLAQLCHSWYILFFQLPWLPEAAARLGNWNSLVQALSRTSRAGTFTEADFDQYRAAWSQPGACRSMLHWYRALLRARPQTPADMRVHVPTLLIWGTKDKFLGREMAQPSIDLCDDGRLVPLEDATHWVQHEEAEHVNQLIIEFVGESSQLRRSTS